VITFLFLLTAFVFVLLVYVVIIHAYGRRMRKNWEKWENEYWLLRNSDAINKEYEIHLSWLARGMDNCIVKRETKN
jgi:cbb3-type cytochrome oxidase subunit 3